MRLSWTKKGAGALALLGVLLLAAVAGTAQQGGPPRHEGPPPFGPGGPHGHGPGDLLGMLAHELNLTDAQQAQIKQIGQSFMENMKGLHEQMHKAGDDPFAVLKGQPFDEAAVRAAAQARAAVQVELEVAHARMLSQVYAVLTPEQKAQLAARLQQLEQEHRQHEGQHGEHP
jgi:protein CpxP